MSKPNSEFEIRKTESGWAMFRQGKHIETYDTEKQAIESVRSICEYEQDNQ